MTARLFIFLITATPPVVSDYARDPCVPSPCGAFSECRDIGGIPSCSCLPTYRGSPPNCRPECTINTECPANMACMQQKCRDPCPGSCGIMAQCSVVNHVPICSCLPDYTGDPFVGCSMRPRKSSAEQYATIIMIVMYSSSFSRDVSLQPLSLQLNRILACPVLVGPTRNATGELALA